MWLHDLLARIEGAYYDQAAFLAFAVQVASLVVLARNDFGLSSEGLGAVTISITWTASLLTLLPLVYGALVPALCRVPHASEGTRQYEKENTRLYLFLICWLLSAYPFFSRMIQTFGPSKIGSGGSAVISTTDFAAVAGMCLSGVTVPSDALGNAWMFLGIVGWLLMALFAIYILIAKAVQKCLPGSALARLLPPPPVSPQPLKGKARKRSAALATFLALVIPVIAIMQIVAVFQSRSYQTAIAANSGNADNDSEWTFGQIVAVIFFAPVLPEAWCAWRELRYAARGSFSHRAGHSELALVPQGGNDPGSAPDDRVRRETTFR